MSARAGYWVVLGVVVVLFMLSKTEKGKQVVSEATEALASGIIGLRLNNPLNVESGDQWQGLADEQKHLRFATFKTMAYGIRAAAIILRNYQRLYNIRTVAAVINRWNPVSDGQPSTYIPNVANDLGVSATAPIDLQDARTMFALIRAMIKMEIGSAAALLVSDADVNEGLRLAGFQ